MRNKCLIALAAAGVVSVSTLHAGLFADAVVGYSPGIGFATDWSTGAGLTNPASALGMPSREVVDPDPLWGGTFPVTPFFAPYFGSDVVSIGSNGFLTVRFDAPIRNDPAHPYDIDLMVHGNTAFMDVDYPNGKADESGSTLGDATGQTRVWVSADGTDFFQLNPSLAPIVDGLFPTDGQGAFGQAVNPALTRGDFANLTLAEVRQRYAGSAGGTGFDLAWAQDRDGKRVELGEVRFVKVEVLSGRTEIDGFAVVPEPSALALGAWAWASLWLLRRHTRASQP